MSRRVLVFPSAVDQTTDASDSAVVSVGDRGNVSLATSGSPIAFGGCSLTVEVSVDGGTTWKALQDADGNSVQLTDEASTFYFQSDGGELRVNPVGASGSTSIPQVYLLGDIRGQ